MAARAGRGEPLTSQIIEEEARALLERDCIAACEDLEIYDYENASACLKRYSDFQDRMVLPDLAEDIEVTRAEISANKKTLEDAFKELDSTKMTYLKYSRGQLQTCIIVMFSRLGLIERFKIDT